MVAFESFGRGETQLPSGETQRNTFGYIFGISSIATNVDNVHFDRQSGDIETADCQSTEDAVSDPARRGQLSKIWRSGAIRKATAARRLSKVSTAGGR